MIVMPLQYLSGKVAHQISYPDQRLLEALLTMLTTGRIEINSKIMLGKPVIRGTRIPVELLLRKLGEGATESDLLDAYPRLTREDIQAALSYAAAALAHEEIMVLEQPEPIP